MRLAAGAGALTATSPAAWAQSLPDTVGSNSRWLCRRRATDIAAPVIGQWLSERFGQPFVIENKPGAASNIATEAVVRAPADGYTLLLAGIPNAINATLYEKLNFNFIRDIAPVASVSRDFLVLVVHPSVPANTIPDLIAYAKDSPGKINMASGGIGAPAHLAGELFNMMTGVNIVHVPYRGGGPAIAALLGGQVQIYFASVATSVEHIRAGKLRALGVTASSRSDVLPDIPAVRLFGPASRLLAGLELACLRTRQERSLRGSMLKSTRGSPMPGSRLASRMWALKCLQDRLPTLAASSATKLKSWARLSALGAFAYPSAMRLDRRRIAMSEPAPSVVSLRRSNSVARGTKRTFSERSI